MDYPPAAPRLPPHKMSTLINRKGLATVWPAAGVPISGQPLPLSKKLLTAYLKKPYNKRTIVAE